VLKPLVYAFVDAHVAAFLQAANAPADHDANPDEAQPFSVGIAAAAEKLAEFERMKPVLVTARVVESQLVDVKLAGDDIEGTLDLVGRIQHAAFLKKALGHVFDPASAQTAVASRGVTLHPGPAGGKPGVPKAISLRHWPCHAQDVIMSFMAPTEVASHKLTSGNQGFLPDNAAEYHHSVAQHQAPRGVLHIALSCSRKNSWVKTYYGGWVNSVAAQRVAGGPPQPQPSQPHPQQQNQQH
jgi:hypothetical protein